MDKMLNTETNPDARKKQKVDYKAEIADLLAQIDVIDERIQRNQLKTEQLRAETRVILAEIRAGIN